VILGPDPSLELNWDLLRKTCLISVITACWATMRAQQPATAAVGIDAGPPPERVKLFNDVQGFTPPILIPLTITPAPENHCDGAEQSGSAKLSFIVDPSGHARNIVFEQAIGNAADYTALRILEMDQFKPGELGGAAVASFGAIEMHLEVCVETKKDQSGHESVTLRLRAQPSQVYDLRFRPNSPIADGQHEVALAPTTSLKAPVLPVKPGSAATPPKPIHTVEAEFSDYARQHNLQGTGLFRLTVDEHGLPHDIVYEPSLSSTGLLDPSLVQQAILAVRQYRFKPAMKDGIPVPVRIVIEVDFRQGVSQPGPF
jgi:hypothetical protein